MSTKNTKQAKNKEITKPKPVVKTKFQSNNSSNLNYYYLLAGIVVLTIIVFSTSINNKFLNWDDNVYVVENSLIKDISPQGIIKIFKSYADDQLPITQLSLAINYHFSELNEKPYHVVNLILHILNVLLVFVFVRELTKRKEIAIIACLLFAVHPLRVESVAWVTERKDMLFTLFFLASMIYYIKYLKSDYKTKFIVISIVLSVLSLMSKLAAITLPVVLILIDYYYGRKFTIKSIAEKLPYFILPFVSGIIHYITPSEAPMVENFMKEFTFVDTLFMANYCVAFYLLKFILPVNIYALYPYPNKVDGMLPMEYYLAPIVVIALIILFIKYYKTMAAKGREILFGIVFFFITIALVLQVIPFGGRVIAADRYTYLPYLGLFMIVGRIYCYIIDNKTEFNNKIKPYFMYGLLLVVLIFSIQTFNRNKIYYDSMSFWNDVIEKNPKVSTAYADRGMAKSDRGDINGAIEDYNIAIELDKKSSESYYNRGVAVTKIAEANVKMYYEKQKNNDINGAKAEYDAGMLKYNDAVKDFTSALKINPKYTQAYYNRGNVYKDIANIKNDLEYQQKAIDEFTKAIESYPDFYSAYNNRGVSRYMLKDYKGTIEDLNVAIKYDTKNGLYYTIRGYAKFNLNMMDEACKDWNMALQYGSPDPTVSGMVQQHCK